MVSIQCWDLFHLGFGLDSHQVFSGTVVAYSCLKRRYWLCQSLKASFTICLPSAERWVAELMNFTLSYLTSLWD